MFCSIFTCPELWFNEDLKPVIMMISVIALGWAAMKILDLSRHDS